MNAILAYFNQPLLRIPLLFGVATGVLSFGYFLALYAFGIPPLGNHKSLDFGITIILMTAAVWYYRRHVGHGMLHLWEGLSICFLVNVVGAFISGWLIYLFVQYVDKNVFTQYLDNSRHLILTGQKELIEKLGADQFRNVLAEVAKTRPSDLIYDEVGKKIVLGVLPILVISLIFRKQDYSVIHPEPPNR